MWTKNKDCFRVIKESWKVKVYGFPMFIFDKELKILKSRLKDWNKSNFGNVKIKVIEAEKVLKEIQQDIGLNGYNDSLHDKEAKA